MACIILLAKVSLYFVDCWVCVLVDGDGALMRRGAGTDFTDSGVGCVITVGV